jgi:hypothetical protein
MQVSMVRTLPGFRIFVARRGGEALASAAEKAGEKLRGRCRVPSFVSAIGQLVFLLAGLLRFLLRCHSNYSPFHYSWICNDRLLQLIECIESLKSEVKQKMMWKVKCNIGTKVTREEIATLFWHGERRVCHAKPSIDELRATDFLVFNLQIRWEATTSRRFGVTVDFS